MRVRVTYLVANQVLRLADLRPRVQSDAASEAFGRCYVGQAFLDGQQIRMDIDAEGHVGDVSFSTFCAVPPEVKSCLTRFVRTLDFSGVVLAPGQISVGLSRPR